MGHFLPNSGESSILIVLKLNNSMIVFNHSLTLFGNGLWVFMLIEKETSPWASFSWHTNGNDTRRFVE